MGANLKEPDVSIRAHVKEGVGTHRGIESHRRQLFLTQPFGVVFYRALPLSASAVSIRRSAVVSLRCEHSAHNFPLRRDRPGHGVH